MMRLNLSHTYEYDTDTVLAVCMDRDYLQQKYEAMGPGPVEFVECGEAQGCFRATIQRQLPGISPGDVPWVARRFVRESYRLIYTVEWDLDEAPEKYGRLRMRLQDVPVTIEGDLRFLPEAQGCVKEFDLVIQSSIPVISGKVEKEAAKLVRRSLDKEHDFSLQYLKEHVAG